MPNDRLGQCIYLDHHATTPMDERVLEKIKPFFLSEFGNPSSTSHPYGWRAQDAVDEARLLVARAINAHPTEIIFTSGATEATNTAIKGLFLPKATVHGRHIVSSSIEHGATLSTLCALDQTVAKVSLIKPSQEGLIDEENLQNSLTDETSLVSLFMVHNEVGTINSIAKLARIAKACGALFHCDAAQALGRVVIDCQELDVDLMSLSGHKIYGPKGVGCLYIRRKVMELICPLIHGGGQEWHKRSGTLNVPGIVGMGEAARLATLNIDEENTRIRGLRDRLLKNLRVLDGVHVNGTLTKRVSGNLNVSFEGIDGEELVLAICGRVAISTGSACSSSLAGKSKVLLELGISSELRQASIRFGLGRTTSTEDIDTACELIIDQVRLQRKQKNTKKKLIKVLRSE
jgi:cysteine desulfurase